MPALQVVMIIQYYLPHLGGAEKQLASLAPLLQAQGMDVRILTRQIPGQRAYECISGIPVRRLPAPGIKPVAAAIFAAASLYQIRKWKPDLIHAHGLLSPCSIALLARRLWGIPVVAKALRGGSQGELDRLAHKPFGQYRIAGLRRRVDRFIAISQEIDAELAGIGVPAGKRVFVPNGVDTRYYQPATPEHRAFLKSNAGFATSQIVLYAGRIEREKRIDLLLRVWQDVRARHLEAELVIVGQGEQAARLKRDPIPGVHWIGQVEDVLPYLHMADVFVLPSITEGLSNAMLEAMSAQVPVIVTRVGAADELIAHEQNGLLIEPENPAELGSALDQLLSDPRLRTSIGVQARRTICTGYDIRRTAGQIGALYTEVVHAPGSCNVGFADTDRSGALE